MNVSKFCLPIKTMNKSRLWTLALWTLGLHPLAWAGDIQAIDNIVVIYAENHSFDNLFGLFPGAQGIAQATEAQKRQLDHDGTPLKALKVFDHHGDPDPAFPVLPNGPFRIDAPPVNRSTSQLVPSPVHAFYQNKEQINNGMNNMFVAMSNTGGWVMGHYDGSAFKLWQWAQEYTLADHFFMAAHGGSYLNHHWLICACTPQHPNAPESMRIRLDAQGKLLKKPNSSSANEGAVKVFSGGGVQVTPDAWSVNTTQPPYQPSGIPPDSGGDLRMASAQGIGQGDQWQVALPPQTQTTIGDTLSAKGVSWAWFAGAYRAALQDGVQTPDMKRRIIYNRASDSPNFQAHHQPFNYYERFAPGREDRERHLKDESDFFQAIDSGTLPAVSFYKPAGKNTQHPSYTDVKTGDEHIHTVLEKLKASPQWKRMLIVVTYDENGGYWDHMPPPTGPGWSDQFGPGTRVPAILIGPQVKRGHVDSTIYDTTSILQFITRRFNLLPLSGVRKNMGDFSNALQ